MKLSYKASVETEREEEAGAEVKAEDDAVDGARAVPLRASN